MHTDSDASGVAPVTCYDVASALWQGARPYQEDSLLQEFPDGMPCGYVVLADGMGGHAAGDVASRLAVETVSDGLSGAIRGGTAFESQIADHLSAAVRNANQALADDAGSATVSARIASTLVTAVLCDTRLYWTSVGDSPMYLWRNGSLHLLNEDHSMAPVIDRMVADGELSADAARNHPDRNALTSVLVGENIARIDLSAEGFDLLTGDVLIVASDGLQFLQTDQIVQILAGFPAGSPSYDICKALLEGLQDLDDPYQDNVSICVLQPELGSEAGQGEEDEPDTRPLGQKEQAAAAAAEAAVTAQQEREASTGSRARSRLRSLSHRMKFWS